jgi:hypothetical protein
MAVERSTVVDGSPREAYEAVRALLNVQIEMGAFKVREDDPGREWGLLWKGPLASSRYLFRFQREGESTRVDATLWLGGALGPVHMVLRRRGNRKHVDRILADVKRRVEDGEELDDEDEGFDGGPDGGLDDSGDAERSE